MENARVVVHVELAVGGRCRHRRGRAGRQTVHVHLVVQLAAAAVGRRCKTGRHVTPAGQRAAGAEQTARGTGGTETAVEHTRDARLTRNEVVSSRHRRLRFDARRLEGKLSPSLLQHPQLMAIYPSVISKSKSRFDLNHE